jgi:putative endonuclease
MIGVSCLVRHIMSDRARRGQRADRVGRAAEATVQAVLEREGWAILGSRMRTAAGEIDLVAEMDGLLVIVEVKARRDHTEAALALAPRQRARLVAAAEIILAEHPDWGCNGVRFDLLLVDRAGRVRRVRDAFRDDG